MSESSATLTVIVFGVTSKLTVAQPEHEIALEYGKKLNSRARRKIEEKRSSLQGATLGIFVYLPILTGIAALLGFEIQFQWVAVALVLVYLCRRIKINTKYEKEEKARLLPTLSKDIFFAREIKILNHYVLLRNQIEVLKFIKKVLMMP